MGLSSEVSIERYDTCQMDSKTASVPAAVPALIFAIIALPKHFSHHEQPSREKRTIRIMLTKKTMEKLDLVGAGLLLLASLGTTAGFEEADSRFPWNSAYVICLLTVSTVLWVALLLWERHVTLYSKTKEPVLPWRFMQNRAMISLLLQVAPRMPQRKIFADVARNAVFLGGP